MTVSIVRHSIMGLAFVLFMNCGSISPKVELEKNPTDRIIKFSGMDWIVRSNSTVKQGPGPNHFSDSADNVWVDSQGRLHLKITQIAGEWYCAGILSKNSFGYGTYTFHIGSPLKQLDKHVVLGLFTYLNDQAEIDIEFSKWSDPDNENAQFAVQPADMPGNKYRFDLDANLGSSTHSFEWREKFIEFESNKRGQKEPLFAWKYSGKDIPFASTERLKLNLWLFKGQIPSDFKEQEIIIDSVSFKR